MGRARKHRHTKGTDDLERGALLRVTWLDAFNPTFSWMDESEIAPGSRFKVRSVGYLYHLTDDYLVMSRDKASGCRGGVFYIPVGCIKRVKVL